MNLPAPDPIATYVEEVAHHLRTRGHARHQALADLEAALRETAAAYASGEAEGEVTEPAAETGTDPAVAAVADFGSARAYAAELDAELRTERRFRTVLGVPNSLTTGILTRMAATFDPADHHVVVPHIFGLGWAINWGAVAVRLGLLNPDDLDDELLERAIALSGRRTRALAWTAVGTAVVAAGTATARRRRIGFTGWADVAGAAAVVTGAGALARLGADRRLPAGQRLVAPAYATFLATIMAAAMAGVRKDGERPRGAGWWGLPLGTLLWWASTYGPVTTAVSDTVHESSAPNSR
ncbi:DUF5808 domain-containing protein [Raineyella fluvialis]|uniref:DUF5808 domain-containing protein n=1 Tax=Raineyella fluvialis TaxID=2662261 RepID=A0A5Q2F944_9ACTN|nr:hypothetical protein [Raineyella fluvialis]QGF23198.1 hypothetical protein Rai3103_05445 [Raineyella fluvialis]